MAVAFSFFRKTNYMIGWIADSSLCKKMQDWTQSDYLPLQRKATGGYANVNENALKRQFTVGTKELVGDGTSVSSSH
jgi:hypothetical protein